MDIVGYFKVLQKIAVLSDIHGNLTALKAVVKDVQLKKVDEVWVLGDLLMPGPGAKEICQLLRELEPTVFLRGNWDDLLLKGAQKKIPLTKQSHIYFTRLAQYTATHLEHQDLTWLKNAPLHMMKKVGPLQFSLSHNLPGLNYGQKLYPTNNQADFDEILTDLKADVALYGHVHHQLLRYTTAEQLILNPGSVGEPFCDHPKLQADLRAQYLLLEVDKTGLAQINFQKVAYDHKKEAHLAQAKELPYLELYQEMLLTGKVHTHDQVRLKELTERYGYLDDIQNNKMLL